MPNPYLHKLVEKYSPQFSETKEFIQPVPDDYFIWWLFKHRCIMCQQPATEINEILPRGRSKFAILDWRNRVPLCERCHLEYHHYGVTTLKQEEMKTKRNEFLMSMGREKYI